MSPVSVVLIIVIQKAGMDSAKYPGSVLNKNHDEPARFVRKAYEKK